MNGFLVLGAALGLAIVGVIRQKRSLTQHGGWIDPNDPLWISAINRARATASDMRVLHADGHEVWVKFSLAVDSGEQEHFWGRVLEVADSSVRAVVETKPRSPADGLPREVTLPFSDLEDWQVQLPDGSIRGGFTTRAQIEVARREGLSIPKHIAEMEPRLKDS